MEAERERERGGADVLAIAQSGMDGRRSDGRAQRGRIDDVSGPELSFLEPALVK